MKKVLLLLIATIHWFFFACQQDKSNQSIVSDTPSIFSNDTLHPRLIATEKELQELRQKLQHSPYQEMLVAMQKHYEKLKVEEKDTNMGYTELVRQSAFLYACTENKKYAEESHQFCSKVISSDYFLAPIARGLDRSNALRAVALCYDFCYTAWTPEQRHYINEKMYAAMYGLAASAGFDANYSIESNWMGIRYAAIALAALAYDDTATITKQNKANPFLWEASKRMSEFTVTNVLADGWNIESIGYHGYGWSFVGLAAIAMQKKYPQSLKKEILQIQETQRQINSVLVSIPAKDNNKGMKPDLSDDDLLSGGTAAFAYHFKLFNESPENQYLKWFFDYRNTLPDYPETISDLFYFMLFMPENLTAKNPEKAGWRNFVAKEAGAVLFRNRFRDENDIVALTYAAQVKGQGHKSFDSNTLRIIGLGTPWVIGAGRTDQTAGQSNLFPYFEEVPNKSVNRAAQLIKYQVNPENGSGFSLTKGSCMDVENHQRLFVADYDTSQIAAQAAFIVKDKSDNGTIWRINTPEFNSVEVIENGFVLTAPNGNTLQATILGAKKIRTGKQRYGGDTERLNKGIVYQGKRYDYSTWVDAIIDKNVTVVMTLQTKGKPHPNVQFAEEQIKVGKKTIKLISF